MSWLAGLQGVGAAGSAGLVGSLMWLACMKALGGEIEDKMGEEGGEKEEVEVGCCAYRCHFIVLLCCLFISYLW